MSDRAAGLRALIGALGAPAAGLTDWSARATTRRTAWRTRDADGERGGEHVAQRLAAQVHADVPAGRGSASFEVGTDAPLAAVVADAAARALASVGPAWRSPPPAAAARVLTRDPEVDAGALTGLPEVLAAELDRAAAAAGAVVVDADLAVELAEVRLATSRGLVAGWPATLLSIDATVGRGERRARIRRRVRRRRDLAFGDTIEAALGRAERRARAGVLGRGSYRVLMRAGAFLHGGRGLLAALVGQADPALERQGLVRYRPGQLVAPGASTLPDPLSLSSDGTIPFGLHSAPLGEHGEPVRRFELIARGVARGLALDAREAYARGAQPNGGVRGLVVAAGDVAADDLIRALSPALVIDELGWLDVAPVTGHFRAGIALATLVDGDRRTDVAGGVVRGDAITALALGRRSQETEALPAYRGPAAWALGELVVD